MSRRKYQFKSRESAEEAYQLADRERLASQWLLTAILQNRTSYVGTAPTGEVVGYFKTTHSVFVYCLKDTGSIHCVRGVWDSYDDRLLNNIAALVRFTDDNETFLLGTLLEEARQLAQAAFNKAIQL